MLDWSLLVNDVDACGSHCVVARYVPLFRPNSPNLASDHPHVFKKDVVERAEHYAAGLTGGVGAYTNSQGIPAVRQVCVCHRRQ